MKVLSAAISITLLFTLVQNIFTQEVRISAAALDDDLTYLQNKLLEYHPGIFSYTSEEEFNSFFDKLRETTSREYTSDESFNIVSLSSETIQDGHTVFKREIRDDELKYFPFMIHWDGTKLYTRLNLSHNSNIEDGTIITNINGTKSEDVVKFILNRLMRDGKNETYRNWVLNNFFGDFYSYFYGHPTTFQLEFEGLNSEELKAISKNELNENRDQRYPKFVAMYSSKTPGIELKKTEKTNTAILVIKDFHVDILRKVYKQNFKKTIHQIFEMIESSSIDNLILDLRDNQGGKVKYGRLLLSYLLSEPFSMVESYEKVGKKDPNLRLEKCKGPSLGKFSVRKNNFKGKLIVLINGGSFSNSGIVCSALKRYQRAVFIGEETGGSAYSLCGNIKKFELPNTKISIEIPRLKFILKTKASDPSGTIPDHMVTPRIEDLISGNDVVLEKALGILSEEVTKH